MSVRKKTDRWTLLAAFAAIAINACGDSTTENDNAVGNSNDSLGAPCSVDFDCNVGEICGTASVCETAGAAANRVFGESELRFADDEAYLVTVFALPDGAVAPDDSSFFTLEGVTAEPNALRVRRAKYDGIDYASRPYWQARLAMANERREKTRALALGMERGERNVFGVRPFQAPSCNCGDMEVCSGAGACVESLSLNVGASTVMADVAGTVSGTSLSVKVLVDSEDSGTTAASVAAATAFIDAAEEVLFLLGEDSAGHAGPLDRDDSGALNLLFSERLPTLFNLEGLVGLFNVSDFLPTDDPDSSGNVMDVLLAVPPTTGVDLQSCQTNGCAADDIPFELALSTLAHEYQHLINFARRAAERDSIALASQDALWLDEGLSHTIEDLVGYGNSNQEVVAELFSEFETENRWAVAEDTIAQRGMAYTLIRHIIDQRARNAGATDASSDQVRSAARDVYTDLLASPQDGYLHALFQELGSEGIGEWLVALYGTDNPEVSEPLSDLFLPTGTDPNSGLTVGFSPFIETIDARGEELILSGPDSDILDDLSGATEGEVSISQALYFVVEGLSPGAITLRATGDANVDLHMRVDQIR